jgi:DeoR/GlpR family transcriptional regulator of sugar metabolism
LTAYERRQYIVDKLRKEACLRVVDVAKTLQVSESTIRNDLNALEDEGRIRRVHGGAVLVEQSHASHNSFSKRYAQYAPEKRAIAREAAEMIQNGDSILLDASSTAFYLAQELADKKQLRIVTNGLETAQELAKNPSNNVFLLGGVVNYDSSSVTGLLSEKVIEDLFVRIAFLSCSGFTMERGMTELQLDEAQLKRKMILSAQKLIALVDASKLGKEDLTPFARIDQINRLITDDRITSEWGEKLLHADIETVVCNPGDYS